MNWEAASAIGEVIGALAVVLTLGYLAKADSFDDVEMLLNRTRRHGHLAGVSPQAFENASKLARSVFTKTGHSMSPFMPRGGGGDGNRRVVAGAGPPGPGFGHREAGSASPIG